MPVADILKEIGDWTTSKELVKLVSKKMEVVETTAYRKIKKEVKEGSIKKITRPDRSVVYGLPNWPWKDEDLKLLIELLKANALQTMATAEMINALSNLMQR